MYSVVVVSTHCLHADRREGSVWLEKSWRMLLYLHGRSSYHSFWERNAWTPFPSNDGGSFAQLTQCSVTPGPDSHSIFTLQTKTTFSFEENAFSWAVDRKKWRIQLPLLDNPKHSTPLVVLLTLHIRTDYILGVFLMNIFYLVTIAKNIPVLLAGWHRDGGDKRGNLGEKWFSQRRNSFFCLLSRFSSLSHLWYHFDLFSLFQLPVRCWII